jgi:hypothetical protein
MDKFFTRGQQPSDPGIDLADPGEWPEREEPEQDGSQHDQEYIAAEPGGDKLWRWVAALAGTVLLTAVVATVMILHGGDNASTAGRVAPTVNRPAVTPAPSPPSPTTSRPPMTSPPSETVTTRTQSPPPSPPPSSATTAAAPAVDPRTFVYTVSGTRHPGDLVTVIYRDERGAFRTDFNVTLPWSRTVVLNPDVEFKSVTATSFASQLNCAITNAHGATLVSDNVNTIAATCNS